MEEVFEEIKFDTDTLIHLGGLPFNLKAGTPIYGHPSNAARGKAEVDAHMDVVNRYRQRAQEFEKECQVAGHPPRRFKQGEIK